MMTQPLDPHRRAPKREHQPEDDHDGDIPGPTHAEQTVAQWRDEHPEKACGRDEAELLEELRYQQPDVHGPEPSSVCRMGRGLRSRAALSSRR
jgi:hypothetical protein